jgi:hypothetical protein
VPERLVEIVARRGQERSRPSDPRRRSGTACALGLRGERREHRFGFGDPAESEQRFDLVGRRRICPRITQSRPGDQRLEDGMGGGYVT